MTISPQITWSLQIGSGFFWTVVYILIIKLGFQEKTYGIPKTALCANLSWEFIFSFIHPHDVPRGAIASQAFRRFISILLGFHSI